MSNNKCITLNFQSRVLRPSFLRGVIQGSDVDSSNNDDDVSDVRPRQAEARLPENENDSHPTEKRARTSQLSRRNIEYWLPAIVKTCVSRKWRKEEGRAEHTYTLWSMSCDACRVWIAKTSNKHPKNVFEKIMKALTQTLARMSIARSCKLVIWAWAIS